MCMKRLEMVLFFKKIEDILTSAQHFYSKHSTCKMHSTPRSNKIKADLTVSNHEHGNNVFSISIVYQ